MLNRVLLVVDVQNDFIDGALPVKGAIEVLPVIKKLVNSFFYVDGEQPVYTRDWHPSGHISFAGRHKKEPFSKLDNLMLWPDHCVQDSHGAKFREGLPIFGPVFSKGMDEELEELSGVDDIDAPLRHYLRSARSIYVCGLAIDYCVRAHVLDLLHLRYEVFVVEDAVAGVAPDTTEQAIKEMTDAGAKFVPSTEILGKVMAG